jgi:hypothetical protein
MLEIKKIFHKITFFMLAGFVWMMIPATNAQAAGYYSGDLSTQDHYRLERAAHGNQGGVAPYFANKDRVEEKMGRNTNVTPNIGEDDYVESGKRAAEVIPKELGTGSRQKNPVDMLKRAGEEVVNNPLKRSFGVNDYDRSPIEEELARNKAERGDYK